MYPKHIFARAIHDDQSEFLQECQPVLGHENKLYVVLGSSHGISFFEICSLWKLKHYFMYVCVLLHTARECCPHFAVTLNKNILLWRKNRLIRTTLWIYEHIRESPPAKLKLKKMLLNVNKNPTDATVCRYLFTAKLLYMFRVSQHPSSGVLKTVLRPDQTTLEGSSGTSSMTCTGGCGYSF